MSHKNIIQFLGCENFNEFSQRKMNAYSKTNIAGQTLESCKKLCAEEKACP